MELDRIAIVASMVVAGSLLVGVADSGADQPRIGSGDIQFRLDMAQFRAASGATEVEFYVEVDNDQLSFVEADGRHQARLEVSLSFVKDGKRVDEWSQTPELWVDSKAVSLSPSRTQVLQVRLEAPAAGADSVHAEVKDLNARKRGLLHVFAGTPRGGKVGAPVELRSFPAADLSISDLEFAQSIVAAEPGAIFVKSGLDVEPNAGRVHGAARRRAAVYYEVYDLRVPPPEGNRRYEIRYRIRNSAGEDVREWSKRLSSSSAAWADTVGFQVDDLISDSYRLSVMVRDQETAARAVIEGGFEVFWTSADWVTWIEEYDRLGLLFLDTPDYERLTRLGVGARERFLAEFWDSVNPDPKAPVNVVREEFMRRVRFANERYTNNLVPGIETDRGRVYIRFGEPDDVRREIIPIQGNDLNTAISQLERESSGGELSGIRGIDDRGDQRAFEVWVYNQRGYQLFPRDEQMSTGVGMQFIFVDDLGTGQNFRLIRSTQPFDF